LTWIDQQRNWEDQISPTISIRGTCPSSLTKAFGSPLLIEYSNLALIFPRYVTCRSLHSAGRISLFLVEYLFVGGNIDFSTKTSLILISSLFLPAGPALSSPSRYVFVPMSSRPWAISPSAPKRALKDSTWGAMAALRAGYAVWSFGGLRKRSSRRRVSNSCVHFVLVEVALKVLESFEEGFGGAMVGLEGSQLGP